MPEKIQPKETFMIRDLETLRVVADPLRTQVLEMLIYQPQTVREVAEKLGLTPGKLYYHFGLLEKHGLVQVAETHQVGNLLEKAYRATASELEIDKSLLNFSATAELEDMYALMVTTLDTTRDDLLRSLQARQTALAQGAPSQPRRVIVNRVLANLSEAQAAELQERMSSLIQEFTAAEQAGTETEGERHLYAMSVAFYPTFYYPPEGSLPASQPGDPGVDK